MKRLLLLAVTSGYSTHLHPRRQTVFILHYVNGNLEVITATVVNGMATFDVNGLSPFAVVHGLFMPELIALPKPDDATAPIGFVLIG